MMRRRLSLIGVGFGIASVVLLRVDRSSSRPAPPPEPSQELRYICIGDLAVELGSERRKPYTHELELALPFSKAARRCRPPLPWFSEQRIAVTAPERGYGAALEKMQESPKETLALSEGALTHAGWRETGGSMALGEYRENRNAATYEKDGAWLMTVAIPARDGAGSYLLTAGEWRPGNTR